MHLIRASEATDFDLPGVRFTALAAPSRGSAELCAWQLTVEPGLESPDAHHLDRDEVFLPGDVLPIPGTSMRLFRVE